MATFTRASKATYINKQGMLVEAGIDEPRFEKEGILIEGASTNLMHGSNNPQFRLNDGSLQDYVRKEMNCPDRVTRELRGVISKNGTPAPSWYCWVPSAKFNGEARVTFSSYIILNSHTGVHRIDAVMRTNVSGHMTALTSYDVLAGTVENTGTGVTSTWEKLSDTMYKASLTYAPEDISAEGEMLIGMAVYTESVQTELYSFGWQVEELPFASSYIPTNGTAVTRAADAVIVPSVTSTIADNTVFAEVSAIGYSGDWGRILSGIMPNYRWEFSTPSQSSPRTIAAYRNYTKPDGSETHVGIYLCIDYTAKDTWNMTVVSKGSTFTSYEGGREVSSVDKPLPANHDLALSIGDSAEAFFHLKNLRIWNHALTAEQIATL